MSADIDIDFADRDLVLKLIRHTPARQVTQGQVRRHNSGVYVTDIPHDPINGCAAIDYEQAEQRGYFKLDFLNMSVYQLVKSPEHYQEMLAATPPWNRLWQDTNWSISIIRPGKAHLQNQLWADVFATVWDGDDSQGYTFKKSHAVSYAALVALHMNLIDNH
jgi:hypothetical protein